MTMATERTGSSLDDAVIITEDDLRRARPRARDNGHYRMFKRLEDAEEAGLVPPKGGASPEHEIFVRFRRRMVRELEGVAAEHEWLVARFGARGEEWELERQSLLEEGGRWYDKMELRLAKKIERTVYFDISSFYGGDDGAGSGDLC